MSVERSLTGRGPAGEGGERSGGSEGENRKQVADAPGALSLVGRGAVPDRMKQADRRGPKLPRTKNGRLIPER